MAKFAPALLERSLFKNFPNSGISWLKIIHQVGFMAPEVANAQYKQDYASPASDLFSLGVTSFYFHPKKLQMAFLSVIMSPFFICRWLFTCWCLVVGNPFGTEATFAQSRIRWRRRLQTIQKLLPIKISTKLSISTKLRISNKFSFSFVIIILNFQVSFAHPEFSGVSAEAKDFIRSKKLERFSLSAGSENALD